MQRIRVLALNLVNRFFRRNKLVAYSVGVGEVIYLDHSHKNCPGCSKCRSSSSDPNKGMPSHWSDISLS